MATIRKEIRLDARPDDVWDAVRDFHAVHQRLAPGFVVESKPDGDDARIVTFFNGAVAREILVGVDEAARRLAYCIPEGLPGCTHHSASAEVIADGHGCRFVWLTDVLPHELTDLIEPMMERGADVLKATLGANVRV
jgi:Polyketide cyclase / dehydrase and lipid transport